MRAPAISANDMYLDAQMVFIRPALCVLLRLSQCEQPSALGAEAEGLVDTSILELVAQWLDDLRAGQISRTEIQAYIHSIITAD